MKTAVAALFILLTTGAAGAPPDWMRTARVALFDAYQYPFAPRLEFDAEAIAKAMADMHVNTIRFASIGKYATIQGVRFSRHPDQGDRDLLREMIAAARPRGIRVIVYVGTGHKLAWSMVTRDYPEYGQKTSPGGGPDRNHFFVGEDHGTICWNTPYRKAYLDMVEHIVRDYDIDGVYFDRWTEAYFWPGLRVCYCDGCRRGFRAASGEELPWHEKRAEYTAAELATIDRYHKWNHEELMGILAETRRIVKSHKDIPLINNINNPHMLSQDDPRVLTAMDAFLYERGNSMLERAEGVSLARAAGFGVWPYVGGYDNWPRTADAGSDFGQEIYTTAMFGGGNIIAQPTGYVEQAESRRYVRDPFAMLAGARRRFPRLRECAVRGRDLQREESAGPPAGRLVVEGGFALGVAGRVCGVLYMGICRSPQRWRTCSTSPRRWRGIEFCIWQTCPHSRRSAPTTSRSSFAKAAAW